MPVSTIDTTTPPSTSTTKPTILIIHGSWHTPAHFQPLVKQLKASGFPTSTPALPATKEQPDTTLADDAQAIRDELTRLVTEDSRTVIVVGHSYGCVVLTEAVSQEFSYSHRRAQNEVGGVTNILYLCGFILGKGASIGSTLGGQLPPWINTDEKGKMTVVNPGEHFYNDLSSSEQEYWVNRLVDNYVGPQFEPTTHTAYLYHPTTYLYCENDQALPCQYQKMMVQGVREATGVTIAEETCRSSHSPFLSMPQLLVELVHKMSGAS